MAAPAPSVPLPRKHDRAPSSQPPLWALSDCVPPAHTPLPAKCDRHGRAGVCCKELRGDDERRLIDPDVVRDVIIGLSDGLTVPFALTAGLSSLGESRLVVLGGVAELIAGAISMGVGGFLASQSERDHYRYCRRQTAARVRRSCAGEMQREVHAVLGPVGVGPRVSEQVAQALLAVELADGAGAADADAAAPARAPAADEENGGLRWSRDVGVTAFLLKFGEGMEEVPTRRLYTSALTIGLGYLLGGLIPLMPYFFIARAKVALLYSVLVTGATLLVFGAVKTHVTGARGGVGGYVWGALSTLCVGGAAAAAAYGIVAMLEGAD